jgi:meso-butanediol dehydrogenase/(S,S)-butanediol dehydrogenase/diacetyl reductase
MNTSLKDHVAVVTGGGTGIGAATAALLAERGAQVTICGRREDVINETAARISAAGGKIHAMRADVSNPDEMNAVLEHACKAGGRFDILVNNAFAYNAGMLSDLSDEDWRACFNGSLDTAFYGIRKAFALMRKNKPVGGSIVNISSVMALLSAPALGAYSSAKAALIALTRSAGLEGAPENIRVNVVVPGVVMTPSTEAMLPNEEAIKAMSAGVPIGRIAKAEEIAHAIAFLASPQSSYITATSLVADGGKTAEMNIGPSSVDALRTD